jgi:hypothetical protein
MRQSIGRTITSLFVLSILALSVGVSATPTTIAFEQFESPTLPVDWGLGAQAGGSVSISTDPAENYYGSDGSLIGVYPVDETDDGTVFVWGGYDVSDLYTRDIYIQFWARMPGAKDGLKFLKIFGVGCPTNCANTTFGLDYTGVDRGSMYQVSFGDGVGTTVTNDTANVINFDGSSPTDIGRSYGTASVSTPENAAWSSSNWGDDWHYFRIHAKFNSGTSALTEVADGEYFVEIDGVVYVDATGLFNRHYSNGPIERVELFGYARGATTAFSVMYDDVRINTDGFEPGC